jgi:hypothetical protein
MSKRTADVAHAIALFRELSAYWSSKGFHGASLYEQLAADPLLPENLHPTVIAELEGVEPSAIAQRRKRGGGPSFIRPVSNIVRYPLADYCRFLAARYVERQPAPAGREYTRVNHAQ